MADGFISPRLLTLAEAKAYLGGKHPGTLGCQPIGRLWDRVEIDHKLDQRAGIESPAVGRLTRVADNDSAEEAELIELERRIARASRRV